MKGTFFKKPFEWSIETKQEAWQQGDIIEGTLYVKNHSAESQDIVNSGVGLAYAEIKKVHSRIDGAIKIELKEVFSASLESFESKVFSFTFALPENCSITDKKGSYFISYGVNCSENHLMLKIEPRDLFTKVAGLLETFHRFKLKELKANKAGVEYKFTPPSSREFSNLESLSLVLWTKEGNLEMNYDFVIRKLDTESATTKISKSNVKIQKTLGPKDFSAGRGLINQDFLLKSIESALSEVRLKNIF
jgi:hypothetical protein